MMNSKQLAEAKAIKKQAAAYSDYLENGIEFVKKFYPDQYDFVIANKDKSLKEIQALVDQKLAAITAH